MDTGLIALNGIPGSGKTLDSVNLARRHYLKENRLYKYYIALLKKKVYEVIKDVKVLSLIIEKVKKIIEFINRILILKIIFILFKKFIDLILLLFLFVECSIYFKLFIVFYFLYLKKFIKSINRLDYDYYCMFPYKKIVNVYSSFPILLDKKLNLWSLKVELLDLQNNYSFLPNSLIIIDEVQLYIDSDEYKDKNKNKLISKIAKFLQAHRHFDIKQIIFTSQSPTRIFKKARNIIIGYLKQSKIINIPFTPFSIMRGVIYFDFEYYGRYIPRDREERRKLPFDYKKVLFIFNRNRLYNMYDSKYLSLYNYDKPLLDRGHWDSFKMPKDTLCRLFEEDGL